MNIDRKDADGGLYRKFTVTRTDGRDREPHDKHWGCPYFVLDMKHDPFAAAALLAYAYADACESAFPALAADLRERASTQENHG